MSSPLSLKKEKEITNTRAPTDAPARGFFQETARRDVTRYVWFFETCVR
jgi:hypothetical protein